MPATLCELEPPAARAETPYRHRIPWAGLLLVLVCLLLFFFRLGDRELASSHEARAGQDAQSMLDSGQWDLPRLFDGQVEMQKPPLYYWLVALLGWLNGGEVDGWCVRLPSALSALGCVLLLWGWGLRRGRPLAGFIAAMMLATCLHFTHLARTGRIDMPLTLTIALTLVGFFEGQEQRRRAGSVSLRSAGWPWFLLGYFAIAAGVMLKGPIAIVLPLAVWIAHRLAMFFWKPEVQAGNEPCSSLTRRVYAGTWWWGIPLVLFLTAPWFLWANYQTDGEFFHVFFWHHNIDRGLGVEEGLRAYPWWYYGPQLLLDLLPWSLLLPLAAWQLWKFRDRDAQFGGIWLLAMLLLLSCMRFKRADYLLPAFPGAAWMLGCAFEHCFLANPRRRFVVGLASIVGVTAALWLAYITLVIPPVEETRTHRRFAEEVRRHTAEEVLFFWAEAHVVAFHVGPPLTTSVKWDVLDAWAGRPEPSFVVMSLRSYQESRTHLKNGSLEVVARSQQMAGPGHDPPAWLQQAGQWGLDSHERPLILVRTHCLPRPAENSYTKR